jgi:putative ABC transport system permease protein
MSLFKIAWRSIQQRSLSSSLTALSMALGVSLVIAVLVIHSVVSRSFQQGAEGYELIVGAKGGKLQLVLNTVYHLSTPVENVPWHYYKEFKAGGRFAKQIKFAIPYCLGDNYEGYRIVGTIPELFETEYAQGEIYKIAQGRNFKQEHFFEAVVGYLVAQRTGLKVGDEFNPTHGVTEGKVHKENSFKVVGVLGPTGTPNDRALFVNMEGFYLLDGHAKELTAEQKAKLAETKPAKNDDPALVAENRGLQPLPEEQREVTSILVRCAHPIVALSLTKTINKEPYAQAVAPGREIANLFTGIVGNLQILLLILAGLIVVVAGIGIMVSIYNSMSSRQREIAIMRALGASRGTILAIVLLESILLSLCGGVLGVLLGHGMIGALSPLIVSQTGVSIGMLQFDPWELVLIPALVVLASLTGYLPALAAYRTNVSRALTATG